MRADINLSVRPAGQTELGTRTEIKNMNGFKAIRRAVLYETQRQIEVLERGGAIVQETRRWDDGKGAGFAMRSKEDTQDYRYFPEPDLPPVEIDDAWIGRAAAEMPELAAEKRARYMQAFSLPAYDAGILTSARELALLFEEATALCGKPKEVANLIMAELMRLLAGTATRSEDLHIDARKVARLVQLVDAGEINRNVAKEVFEQIYRGDADPDVYIREHGLLMVRDDALIANVVDRVLAESEKSVTDYKNGKQKAFGFLVGQIMRALDGKADPQTVNQLLRERLEQL